MTKIIYLVRHGQTFFNSHHLVQGRCDSPLTAVGIQQVKATRDYFNQQGIHFDQAYTSTQERACDTLELLTNLAYQRLKDLRERDYGIFEGSNEFLLPWNQGGSEEEATMEPVAHVLMRMRRAVSQIVDEMTDGQTTLIAAHGDLLARYVRSETAATDFPGFKNAAWVKLAIEGTRVSFVASGWPPATLQKRTK